MLETIVTGFESPGRISRRKGASAAAITFAKFIRDNHKSAMTLSEYEKWRHNHHCDLTNGEKMAIRATRIDNDFLSFTYGKDKSGRVQLLYFSKL